MLLHQSSPAKKKVGILGGDNTTVVINGRKITLGEDIILKVDDKDIQNIMIFIYIENNKKVGYDNDILITALRNGLLQYNTVKLESNPTNYLP